MPDLTTLLDLTERTVTADGERRTVKLQRPYDAAPAELWSAWTEPERAARWLGVIDGDREVGGTVQLIMSPPDKDVATVRIETCEEPHRLAGTWSWPGEDDSRVEVTLDPDGGGTVLTLEHSSLTATTAIDYGCGWEDFLNRLNELVAGRDPRSISWLDAQRDLKPLWQAKANS
jgi:uncharacterized protein YndB with AHSA1/START domain